MDVRGYGVDARGYGVDVRGYGGGPERDAKAVATAILETLSAELGLDVAADEPLMDAGVTQT